ncbi:ARM repeat-containing protein [Hysterangium stoloniferum]|nr:ARM repeat-containing protein [Hysterangium stoloniferum]
MGKAQKKKAIRRHNPVRVPDSHLSHGLASASSASSKADAILPIIQKLGSPDTSERVWACAAVSNLIQNDPSTRRLLQGKNIVAALITRLSDSIEEVVVEAAGALRNLCVDGGYDICAEMFNKNMLAPLRAFPAKVSATLRQLLENPKSAPDGARRLVYEFAENIITIFWCLSETSNKALKAVNDINLIPFLLSFLQARDHLPLSTVNSAAQCLYVLTEDNDPAIEAIRSESSYVNCLVEIAQSENPTNLSSEENNKRTRWLTLRVLASGVLRNITPLPTIIPASTIDVENTILLPLLAPQLSLNLENITTSVGNLLEQLPDQDEIVNKPSLQHAPGSDHKTSAERDLGYIEENLRVALLALEILTGMCAKLPEPEPVTGDIPGSKRVAEDEELDDEMELDEEKSIEEAIPTTNGDSSEPRKSTNGLLGTLSGPLVALVHPTALSFPPSATDPSRHPPTTSALSSIHVRALECLNNLFLAIDEAQTDGQASFSTQDKEGARALWDELWGALAKVGKVVSGGKIVASRGLERKREIWEIAMGALWGVARVSRGYLIPDAEQVQALIEFCDAVEEDMTKVKCIGTLECLAQNTEAIEANKIISTYFLSRIASPSSGNTESCLQSASALIDIYSDEAAPYDVNFRQNKWVEALERALPGLRKLVRGIDRRKPGGMELRSRGDEVVTNLAAFIKYRKALKLH